ncbi:hypothetical protein C0J52_07715 [Blattella germanica]|nr:hypothetical protein C0J52_07715 [Blattella germanica]
MELRKIILKTDIIRSRSCDLSEKRVKGKGRAQQVPEGLPTHGIKQIGLKKSYDIDIVIKPFKEF